MTDGASAKKAAAKKTPAKKSSAPRRSRAKAGETEPTQEQAPGRVDIIVTGMASGEPVSVAKATADRLIAQGHARLA